jgi:universal stress protein A
VRHVILVRVGSPVDEVILKAELELEINLVVMATHGQTGLLHLLTGGVAERLIHESHCPVLTVSEKAVVPS